jgi:hypothetical protein
MELNANFTLHKIKNPWRETSPDILDFYGPVYSGVPLKVNDFSVS